MNSDSTHPPSSAHAPTRSVPHSPERDALLRSVHSARDAIENDRASHFGALVAHDLNNALFALIGRLQIARRKATDPALATMLDEVLKTAHHLESQVNTLHAACPRRASAPASTLARPALTQALERATETLPLTLASVDDAMNAIALDGTITLDASGAAGAIAQLLSIHRARGAASLTVHCCTLNDDPGTRGLTGDGGIWPNATPASSAPRVDAQLELSFTDREGEWTHGLSAPSLLHGSFELETLALGAAQRIVREAGGRAELSRTADGLRSTLVLPLHRGVALSTLREDAECEHDGSTTPHARRVLIADDDVAVRAVFVAALEAVGDDVDTTDDPSSIARRTDLDGFDVIVLDAGGGGLAALREIRARGSTAPVLIASGDLIEGDFGAHTRVLMKPFQLHELDRILATLAALRPRRQP